MKPTLVRIFALPRRVKQLVLMSSDLLAVPCLFWLSLAFRYETLTPPFAPGFAWGLPVVGVFGVAVLTGCGVYRAVTRAFDEGFLHRLLLAVSLIAGVLFSVASLRWLLMPRTAPLIFGFFLFLWIWATRSAVRGLLRLLAQMNIPVTRVAIYGAGAAGRQILAALRAAPEYLPVAFFDDESQLVGAAVKGLRVHHGKEFARLHKRLALDEVLIALPSSSRARRREVVASLGSFAGRVRMLPGLTQLMTGGISISDMREIDIVDLLGRDPVAPLEDLFNQDIAGKRVMITGAGGSIGSELCRQVLARKPELLLLCDVSEYALYTIELGLLPQAGATVIVPVLGSVLEQARMTRVMTSHRIDTVYHAAAYKHVPLVECNPFEGIINNTVGTQRAANAAMAAGVSTFVLISTDKAVRPTNVMGASKRLAEMVLQALAAEPTTKTRFCIVRFGNVLGSSGSVVPLFRAQIARGGPVTVTHPAVTRYFMTIPEAAQLVIQAGAMGRGGDVFVLDMGESVKIVDLARNMIRLSGLSVKEPDLGGAGDIELLFTGLRPGEKLYEELLIGDNASATDHPRIMRASEKLLPLDQLVSVIEALAEMAREQDVAGLKYALTLVVEGYVPDARHIGAEVTPLPMRVDARPDPVEFPFPGTMQRHIG